MATVFCVTELANAVKKKRGERSFRSISEEIGGEDTGGVSIATLSRVESSQSPDFATYLILCDWLKVSPMAFLRTDPAQETEYHRGYRDGERQAEVRIAKQMMRGIGLPSEWVKVQ
jgi:transcriptional regulator with XRE-family HTH domain